jgi:hypothetical protein
MSDFFAGRDQRAVADALERAGLAAEYQQIFLDNEVKKKKKKKKNQRKKRILFAMPWCAVAVSNCNVVRSQRCTCLWLLENIFIARVANWHGLRCNVFFFFFFHVLFSISVRVLADIVFLAD